MALPRPIWIRFEQIKLDCSPSPLRWTLDIKVRLLYILEHYYYTHCWLRRCRTGIVNSSIES
jgi:hypothetical protein